MIEINPQKIDYTQRKSTEEKNPRKLVKNVSRSGDLIFRGGLALQSEIGVQNVERFANFLTTPQGKTFLLKQTLLQSLNKKAGTRIYNPLATSISKGLSQEFTSQKPQRHLDVGDGSLRGVFRGIIGRSQPRTQQENAVRFFDNKLNKEVNLQVRYGGELGELNQFPNRSGALGKEVKDFIKFRIRDAVNGKYIIFPALISGISDNSSAEVSPTSYIGRADKVYVYGGYTRSISFSLDIVAQREEDIPIIWEKINYAKGLTLPQYKQFFSKTDVTDNTRPVAPIVYLTLGDMFNDAPGFFTSVNLTIPENSTWELEDGRQVPHLCQLAFEFTYIGKENPTMTSKHYDNISDSFSFEEKGQDKTKPKRKKLIGALKRVAKKASERRRKKRENLDELSFGEAFKKKRAELGPNKTFTWRGKQYNTNRADD
tara:strand:+ start:207 stop:1490 length:1284 start_codon:yes stop_codon:yes gene_type:complete